MKLLDYFKLGWDQLKRRVVVTLLCTMGIAIGSASIVVAISFGESLHQYSQKQMSKLLMSDEIIVTGGGRAEGADPNDPNSAKPYELTKAKIGMMRTFPHIKALATYRTLNQFEFEVDSKKGYIDEIFATELDTLPAFGHELQQGGPSEQENTIILSYGATMGLFDSQLSKTRQQQLQSTSEREARNAWQEQQYIAYPVYQKQIVLKPRIFRSNDVGETVDIQIPVRVVGILKKPEGFTDDMLMRQKTAYVSPALGKRLQEAIVQMNGGKVKEGKNSSQTADYNKVQIKVDSSAHVKEVESLLKKLKLTTSTNLQREESMQNQLFTVRLIFGGAGVFILLVASISIIVAMTMSTYQRKRQIGIMKVLGANLGQIRNMFMVESALLGLLGGLVGILVSYWVIWGISIAIMHFNPPGPGPQENILFISPWILPVGLFFAIMTGVLSGIYPAIKASRTDALTAIKRD
ncbi:MacB-like core domain-containing protein [Paenibacillus tianmuensis]|uniref:MacB-like core domain-containing protein n=1 Tax=Paenibacillus tianmuensis TaxID=624147 RepID=A0A1G4RR35_9BACL|nr:ABC transporter permease [Paenibacillus tianmuensis]SCW59334.1 MacB-like core domain-containing protein [Paenibacillus tianmuensis]